MTKTKEDVRTKYLEGALSFEDYINKKHTVSSKALRGESKRVKGVSDSFGKIINKDKLEKEIEKEIISYLQSLGVCIWEMKIKGEVQSIGNGRAILKKSKNSGFPDLLCCVGGKFIGIEVKKPGGLQSADQISMQKYIEQGQGVYILATCVETVRDEFRRLKFVS